MDSDTDNSVIVEKNNPTIDFKWAKKAINALLKHEAVQPKKVNDLLLVDQPVTIWLVITTFKFSDKPKLKPVSIPLKHPLYGSSTEICLITKDPQRTYKEWVTTQEVERVQKVIGVSKLRKKYMPYEAKRNLCDSYDLFLADERVLPLLPKILGKYFFEKKKQPVPVNISKEINFKKEILKACHCTYMHYSSGVCLSIKMGTTGMTSDQLLENLEMAIPIVIDKIPRKWKNIQSLYIKTPESTSLPIYNRLPDLPIEIGVKKETPNDGIESEFKISKSDSGKSESEDESEDENGDESDNEGEDEMDEDEDEVNEKDDENIMGDDEEYGEDDEDDEDEDNTDDDEEEDTDEEKPVKKRKVSKETRSVIGTTVPKSSKNSQVKNFSANKKKEKKAPGNKKDVNKKEKSSSTVKVEVTKKSNMKKAGKKANGAIKTGITVEPKKANVKGKEARIMAEAKKNNSNKSEESNSSRADSNRNKQKKSNMIKAADFTINTKNKKKDDKDLLDEKVSSFIAEQKKKLIEQKKVESSKSNNIEAVKSATSVENKKVIKKNAPNVPEKKKEIITVKSVGNSERSEKKKDKKNYKSINPRKKNAIENKKEEQKKGADADNNKQGILKRKRETNKSNKKSIKINNNTKKE